ncbi:metallophosphoesterase family protein [Terrarubrum flagellatum]|uniref:metallophosphoesterase family protein n=1 Tax=Terrirubrum flagellatum TaxID=2895980 RepID=UPI0031452B96
MRLALLSDIHANREGLDACLADARRRGYDRLAFLGDIVGYGADPAAAIETVRAEVGKGAIALLGNHDAAIDGDDSNLNRVARAALAWQRTQLSAEQRAFLRELPLTAELDDVTMVHATACAPRGWEYVLDNDSAERCIRASEGRVTFCGHVHAPALWLLAHNGTAQPHRPAIGLATPLSAPRRWLAVIGSVGQPRDHSPAAGYAIFDTELSEITFLRVPYDCEAAARKILAAGLPENLALRLMQGQ